MVVHFPCVSEMQFAMSSRGIVKPTAVAVDELLFFAAAAGALVANSKHFTAPPSVLTLCHKIWIVESHKVVSNSILLKAPPSSWSGIETLHYSFPIPSRCRRHHHHQPESVNTRVNGIHSLCVVVYFCSVK